jgi:CRISPR-associated endonuclease/helicase Cas3
VDRPWAHAPLLEGAEPHFLDDHLRGTAALAKDFLPPGVDPDLGIQMCLRHDQGKSRQPWQQFIRTAGKNASEAHIEGNDSTSRKHGPPHSPEGALRVLRQVGTGDVRRGMRSPLAMLMAWVIYGHHGGLKDSETLKSCLGEAADTWKADAGTDAFCAAVEPPGTLPELADWLRKASSKEVFCRSYELLVRMMYSALVDADFLDTERYFAQAGDKDAETNTRARATPTPTLQEAWTHLETKLADLDVKSDSEETVSVRDVNALRRDVRSACLDAANLSTGLFSLTVPTGGAKTLGSLAFAIQHAIHNGLQRVIVAVPFTSITEQTATVFRDFLPPGTVLEHHSNLDPVKETAQSRVASENWDMPVIVTTQVQLFESLLANRSSHCRKLHNLCRSVLVLDEVQSLPAPYLLPVLDLLDELARHYGTTVLLTTATQPELHARPLGGVRFQGLSAKPMEIIPESLGFPRRTNGKAPPGPGHLPSESRCPGLGPGAGNAWHPSLPPLHSHVPSTPPQDIGRDQGAPGQRRNLPSGLHPVDRSWRRCGLSGGLSRHGRPGSAGPERRTLQPKR